MLILKIFLLVAAIALLLSVVFLCVAVIMAEWHREKMQIEVARECAANPGKTGAGEISIEETIKDNPELAWYYQQHPVEAADEKTEDEKR
jgi:hypothetical protein